MKLDRVIRIAIAAVILLVFIVAIGAMLFLTEAALNVWDRLVEGPRALLYGYVMIMAALAVTALWLIWRLVVRRKIPAVNDGRPRKLTRGDIEQRLRDAEASGVDVDAAQAELRELAKRQAAGAMRAPYAAAIAPSTFSTRTAENLNSGIFP